MYGLEILLKRSTRVVEKRHICFTFIKGTIISESHSSCRTIPIFWKSPPDRDRASFVNHGLQKNIENLTGSALHREKVYVEIEGRICSCVSGVIFQFLPFGMLPSPKIMQLFCHFYFIFKILF